MGQNAIVVVEQEGDAGRRQLLPLQHLLRHIQQQVAGDHAALALLQRGLDGVALLAGGKEHVGPGQPAAVAAIGVLVPGPLARIVVERPRQFPDRFRAVGQKQPSRFDPGRVRPRDHDHAERSLIGRLQPRARFPPRAVDGVHFDERAVVVAHIQVEELVVVLQHRREQRDQPRIILDLRGLHRRQRIQYLEIVPHQLQLRADPVRRQFGDLADELTGGRIRDRGDPLKTEIDQRQADDEHDRDEQRDDGGLEAELNASASSCVRAHRSIAPHSERIDVVEDRDLPQQHLADDVGRLDVFGEDRGRRRCCRPAGAARTPRRRA